ncbi:MAG: N-acetylmuramoyl-L-alanine amidase [Glaciecola sp.]|jgi:N-acetylmuramoyl-L-alanine amidase
MLKTKRKLRTAKGATLKGLFQISGFRLSVVLLLFVYGTTAQNAKKDSINFIGEVKTIVIDAGHGGHDPGCLGSSAREKHVCLSIALKLGKMIENYFPDVNVIYTRKTDVFVKLHERAEIANRNKADLFISIHANSAQSKSAKGTETFVMGTKYTDKNLEISKRENAVILLEDDYQSKYDGYDPNSPIWIIINGLYQQEYLGQSINLANKVERQFVTRNKRFSRGVKQRVLLVMYRTAMPSVLIEVGFLTNASEHAMLKKKSGQLQTSGAIFRAFLEYKREMEGATPLEIANEEKLVFDNWKKIFDGDSAVIDKVKPDEITHNKEIKVDLSEAGEVPDLLIKVQITSSSKKIPLNSRKFSKVKGVEEFVDKEMYKYSVGQFEEFKEASKAQKEAREKGFKDAFLIAFYKGKKISIRKAREIISGE